MADRIEIAEQELTQLQQSITRANEQVQTLDAELDGLEGRLGALRDHCQVAMGNAKERVIAMSVALGQVTDEVQAGVGELS